MPPTDTQDPDLNPDRWVDDYGDLLFRFAMLCLREKAAAEDVVQETFLGAWRFADHADVTGGICRESTTPFR